MEVRAAVLILLASSLAPPTPANGFALNGVPGNPARQYFRPSGSGPDTPHVAREVNSGWPGEISWSGCHGSAMSRKLTATTSSGSRRGSGRSRRASSSTLAAQGTNGGRCGQQLRRGRRRDHDSAATGIARMAFNGEDDEDGVGDCTLEMETPRQAERTEKAAHRVIFMRHGESEWNRDNRFLGWADIDLTEEGKREAKKAANILMDSGTNVDEVFCSYLKRSIKSAWILAAEMDQAWMPIYCDWRLNEQMYGALTGLNKRKTAELYGEELTQRWRRSYETAPPAVPGGRGYFPVGDPKYAALTPDDIPDSWCGSPNTESLKDAQARAWMLWRERVVPSMRRGKTVLICAHGNVIRAMLKRLDCIPNDALKEVSIPRAVPLVYDLDQDFEPIRSCHVSVGPLRGYFLGDAEELHAALQREGMQLGPVGVDGAGVTAPEVVLEIVKLVRAHASAKEWREWLRAPLEHAAADGNMELFTRLIDAGANADPDWRGYHGRTLLGAAAQGNSEEMVQALLNAGHSVEVEFGGGKQTALHVAAFHGAEKSSSALLLSGADATVLDRLKRSPLHLAAEAGHRGMVNILLIKGVDPNIKGGRNETPLHRAAVQGHAQCVSKLLAGGADKDSRTSQGETPLHMAARNNCLGVVEELLAAGADFDLRGDYFSAKYNALDFAANRGYVDVVMALIRHGSSVKVSDDDGFTSLHRAAGYCRPRGENGDVIRALLDAGADIEAKLTTCGSTPLHRAAYERMETSGTIRALLEGGANVNARGTEGYTPLHWACVESCVASVEELLRWGADEALVTSSGETAADLLGGWERDNEDEDEDEDEDNYGRGAYQEELRVDDRRIRHMLERAPADRSWRRRGWLVLARSRPAKVQLAAESDRGGGSGSRSCVLSKTARACYGVGGRSSEGTADLAYLVERVVGMDVEGVFRLVVGFL
eukprot:g11101.t1